MTLFQMVITLRHAVHSFAMKRNETFVRYESRQAHTPLWTRLDFVLTAKHFREGPRQSVSAAFPHSELRMITGVSMNEEVASPEEECSPDTTSFDEEKPTWRDFSSFLICNVD